MSCVSVIMTMMTLMTMLTIRMMMMKWQVAVLHSEPCLVFNDLYRPI